jgi:hypothetical protein
MVCPTPTYFDYYSSGGNAGVYTVGTREVKDPAQGDYLCNCSLIAALASLAWKKSIAALKNHTINKNLTEPYTFTFYSAADTPATQQTNGWLPQDANRKLLHAHSDTDPREIWPALWEKAYYQWIDKLPKITDKPDYRLHTEWQSAITLLLHLTGSYPFYKKSDGMTILNATTTFNDISNWSTVCAIDGTFRSIKSPAVAWSFDPKVVNPANVQFSLDTIPPQHTYSLLGVAGNYIVLRNPYGSGRKEPTAIPVRKTDALWCSNNINLVNINDGIFAILVDDFVKYFEGYAWMPI